MLLRGLAFLSILKALAEPVFSLHISPNTLPRTDALIGWWKLDGETGLRGVNGSSNLAKPTTKTGYPNLVKPCTKFNAECYSVDKEGPLARFDNITNPESFTIGFWFNSSRKGQRFSGIVRIGDRFSVTYDGRKDAIRLFGFNGVEWGEMFHVTYLGGDWTFASFTFDSATGLANAYYGDMSSELQEPNYGYRPIFPPNNGKLNDQPVTTFVELGMGRTEDTDRWAYMLERDQMACVFLYGETLTFEEVNDIWRKCFQYIFEVGDGGVTFMSPQYLITFRNKIPVPAVKSPPFEFSPDRLLSETKECLHYFSANLFTPILADEKTPLRFSMQFGVENMIDISNTEQTIAVTATVLLVWKVGGCPRPQYHDCLYANDTQLIPAAWEDKNNIWQPTIRFISAAKSDIYMAEMAKGDELYILRHLYFYNEYQTYEFQWMREGSFVADCVLRLERFPFDSQTCSFNFTLNRDIDLLRFDDGGSLFTIAQDAFDSTEWKLMSKKYSIYMEQFGISNVSAISFSLVARRIPDFYLQNLFAPTFVLGILELGAFLIPPHDVERPTFTVTLVLAFTVTQSDVLSHIPKVPQQSLLGSYVQNLEWFSAGLTLYVLLMVPISASKRHLRLYRLIDITVFVIALSIFAAINYTFLVNFY